MQRLYENKDLQKVLSFMQKNKEAKAAVVDATKDWFKGEKDLVGDKPAILRVIESGNVEDFDRYDSAVCDKFIRITETVFGTDWHENGIKFGGAIA